MQPFGTELPPTGPVVASDTGGRTWLIAAGAAAALLVLAGLWFWVAGDEGGTTTVAANQNQSGFVDSSSADEPGGLDPVAAGDQGESDRSEPGPPPTSQPPVTAPPAAEAPPENLLTEGAGPAIEAIRDAVGRETRFTELVIYDSYVIATFQAPSQPENLDRVTWRDGAVSAPEPDGFNDDPALLFSLGEVDLATVPRLADEALAGFGLADGEVTHAIVDRFFGLDDQLAIRVYVSDPDRGGGGYLLARADGSVVELIG